MIFDPAGGWGRAAESSRSAVRLWLLHLFPLLLVGCVAEGYGMVQWGKRVGTFGTLKHFAFEEVLRYEACQVGVGLLVLVLGAMVMRGLANTFHARQTFTQALTVSVFGLGPVMLLRVLDAFPGMPPLLPWALGAVLTMAILYQGVPRVMRLDPAHALGVYMSSMLVLVLVSGLGRVLVVYFLQARVLGLSSAF